MILNLTFQKIIVLLTHYGYFMVFPIAILEGPIISIICGFLVSTHVFNIFIVFFILLAGDIVGDTLYYIIGYVGGRTFIARWGKYIGVTENRVNRLEKFFGMHDWKILLFGKTQAIGSAVLFAAGMTRISFVRFTIFNLIGTAPKIILFLLIGYYFGKAFTSVNTYVNYFAIGSFILSALLFLGYVLFKRYLKKHATEFDV